VEVMSPNEFTLENVPPDFRMPVAEIFAT
jgi:hypothetical protein